MNRSVLHSGFHCLVVPVSLSFFLFQKRVKVHTT